MTWTCKSTIATVVFCLALLCLHSFPARAARTLTLMDAVSASLGLAPDISLKTQEIRTREGALQQAAGNFDPTLGLSASSSLDNRRVAENTDQEQAYTTYGLQVNKTLRTGISLGTTIGLSRDRTSYQSPSTVSSQSMADVYFSVNIPLLKGLGRDAAGAQEQAAAVQLEISGLDLRHTLSRTVRDTARAYWQYWGAFEQLNQQREAEKRAQESVRITRALIRADQAPRSLLENARAKLAFKRSGRIQAEQVCDQMKQALGLAMGVDFDAIESLGLPGNPLPIGTYEEAALLYHNRRELIASALEKRYDHKILDRYQTYTRILIKEAQNQLLPQLDLNLKLGYSGWREGAGMTEVYSPFYGHIPGGSISAGLSYEIPVPNNRARGLLRQVLSEQEKYAVELRQNQAVISSAIAQTLFSLMQRIRELKEADNAIAFYEKSVKDEEKKFKLGMATLSDLLALKDDLDEAVLRETQIRQQYAQTLTDLGYHTASLVQYTGETGHVFQENLVRIPTVARLTTPVPMESPVDMQNRGD